VARHLFPPHLLNTIVTIVDPEDLLAPQQGDADDKDVLANEHIPPMKLPRHGELAPAHMGHQQYGCSLLVNGECS
jgi:hypothetical protein